MKSRIASVLVVAAALLAGSAQASSKATKESVKLDRATVVGETVLPAGTYAVELAPDHGTVRFVEKGQTVAEAPCRAEFAEAVYPGVAVHYRTGGDGPDRLVKIVFASSNLAIEFPGVRAVDGDTPLANAVEPKSNPSEN
jgi:hypothetical protein